MEHESIISGIMASKPCGMCGGDITEDDVGSLMGQGLETICRISIEGNDGLADELQKMRLPIPIHSSCRRKYTTPSIIC